MVGGDLNPPQAPTSDNANFTFVKTDVTSWSDLSNLFKTASSQHGRIDHAFANAGIGSTSSPLDENLDPTTDELLEPSFKTYDVNLRGVVNTTALAFHYMRRQDHAGSVVMTSSASAFQPFALTDYAAAKHAVLGLMRGCVPLLQSHGLADKIRVNCIAPSWTATGLMAEGLSDTVGKKSQTPHSVARSVALLMADQQRTGELVYIAEGKFREIDQAVLLRTVEKDIFGSDLSDNEVLMRIQALATAAKQAEETQKESGK